MTDDDIIDHVLQFEGGFTNHPADRGGPTNFGITAARLGEARGLGRDATVAEVQALTRDEAKQIYKTYYLEKPNFGIITDGNLRFIVVDTGVLHGTGRAARWLQQVLHVTVDGALGPQTSAALAAADPRKVSKDFLALRFQAIGSILSNDHSQVVFAAGWLNRAAALIEFA
jgi:lysozyme family protein